MKFSSKIGIRSLPRFILLFFPLLHSLILLLLTASSALGSKCRCEMKYACLQNESFPLYMTSVKCLQFFLGVQIVLSIRRNKLSKLSTHHTSSCSILSSLHGLFLAPSTSQLSIYFLYGTSYTLTKIYSACIYRYGPATD